MKSLTSIAVLFVALAAGFLTVACSDNPPKAPDVSSDIRHALDQGGLNEVSVSQDRDKNVVALTGNVPTDDDKAKAESIAKSIAGAQVVSNEIGVRPSGDDTAKKVDSALDSGIDKNLEAMLVQHKLKKDVSYNVTNGVVTLKGDVPSQTQRAYVEKIAGAVPNVKQVVNELEVKHQKATSTK
jgi:hyperosmotically inducible protein